MNAAGIGSDAIADEIARAAASPAEWLVDVGSFRAARLKQPLRSYDALMPGQDQLHSRSTTDRIRAEGWRHANLTPVSLEPPIDWENVCAANRSWAFHLHSLDALGPILGRYDQTREPDLLAFAAAVVLDWCRCHATFDAGSPFAWYDMAVGVRAYRLGYVADLVARADAWSDDDVAILLQSVRMHVLRLADDGKFAARTNHGFFQTAGQLALAARFPELPGLEPTRKQAGRRLQDLIEAHFTSEGIHREHSPGYHLAVTSTFETMLRSGLAPEEMWATAEVLEDRFAWFVLPDATMAELGDTEPPLKAPSPPHELLSPHLRYVLTDGQLGELPAQRVQAFPESGYVFFRSTATGDPGPHSHSSYLVQTCAFHSRTHKHADDLSFIWYDRGVELLTDAGRYGYLEKLSPGDPLYEQGHWYGDPKRVYVESTLAHNTVEIDGRSHERKGVTPYGSALRRWGTEGALCFAESAVTHRRSIQHTRLLVLSPGDWLLTLDALADTARSRHDYVQRFLFGEALDLAESEPPGGTLAAPDAHWSLHVIPLLAADWVEPIRGGEEPLAGWISRAYATLDPVWSSGFAARNVASHVFATLFSLGGEAPIAADRCRANATGRRAQLGWSADGRAHRLEIDREPAKLQLKYEQTPES